ncbi:MAG TPA: MFS transporter [Steroidobacteraceae bacterium]|nr:MFS transporter [Steroidobacteraceae bacterium]
MSTDPRDTISNSPLSWLQIIAVAITVGLNALDGFDVLSISFASPGIAAEWGIDRGALGIVLSMELIGMALGSIFLGGVADKIGRRPTMLGCLVLMTVGMFMVTTVKSLVDLSVWRIVTGLGIGGMLAAINAVAAEVANLRRRHLCVSIMAIGYPIGAVIGGTIVARLLQGHDWRAVFYFGSAITAAFIPLVYFLVPESIHWLTRKQPAGALESINRTLRRFGHGPVTALPVIAPDVRRRSVSDLFAPGLVAITVLLTTAYFLHVITFYFLVKWVPKIVVDMGFVPASAAQVLVWTNVGGATGGALLGLLALRFGVRQLTIIVMILSTVAVTVFGRTPPDLQQLSLTCAIAGFCTNAAIVGMYAIFAQAFPTHVRASGTGFAVGVGRGGAMLAPVVAGFLFKAGQPLPTVAILMSLGSVLAAGLLLMLRYRPADDRASEQGATAASRA